MNEERIVIKKDSPMREIPIESPMQDINEAIQKVREEVGELKEAQIGRHMMEVLRGRTIDFVDYDNGQIDIGLDDHNVLTFRIMSPGEKEMDIIDVLFTDNGKDETKSLL